MGGEVIAVTSQEQTSVAEAKATFELDFEVVSDSQCAIAQALMDRGILEIFVDDEFPKFLPLINGVKDFSEVRGGGYQVGMYQPAVVAIGKDFTPFFLWASIPGAANMGGAMGRPLAQDAIAACSRGLDGDLSSVHFGNAKGLPAPARALFYLLVLANGNFMTFRGLGSVFQDGVEVQTPMQRIKIAMIKLIAAMGTVGAYGYLQRNKPSRTLTPLAAYAVYLYQMHGDVFKSLMRPQGAKIEDGLLRKRAQSKM